MVWFFVLVGGKLRMGERTYGLCVEIDSVAVSLCFECRIALFFECGSLCDGVWDWGRGWSWGRLKGGICSSVYGATIKNIR